MAVDHAERARWASRVLRIRQAGLSLPLADIQSTAGEMPDPEEADEHTIGAPGHPLAGVMLTFRDLNGEDNYVSKLFDMDVDELVEEWRKETGNAHEQMVGDGAMTRKELDACYASQEEDEETYHMQAEDMQSRGSWPEPHRLGHGEAMRREG